MKDERVSLANQKVRSEFALIMYLIIVTSFMIKILVLDFPMEECMPEWLIMILFPIYQNVRLHTLRINAYEDKPKNYLIPFAFIAVVGLIFTSIYYIVSKELMISLYMFGYILLILGIGIGVNMFNRHQSHKLDNELDD